MKNEINKPVDVFYGGKPFTHYQFNISMDIDDKSKYSKAAIEWFEMSLRRAMIQFKKGCNNQDIPLYHLEME